MLTNSILGDMSVNDLNQRYTSTVVKYGGVPTLILGFSNEDNEMIFNYRTLNGNTLGWSDTSFGVFEWEKLDTTRPPARWYRTRVGLVYFSLLISRQFQRGICTRNSHAIGINNVSVPIRNWENYLFPILDESNYDIDWKFRRSCAEVHQDREDVLLSPYLAISKGKKLFYRARHIGDIESKTGVSLYSKLFKQEVEECITDMKISFYPDKTIRNPNLKGKKRGLMPDISQTYMIDTTGENIIVNGDSLFIQTLATAGTAYISTDGDN